LTAYDYPQAKPDVVVVSARPAVLAAVAATAAANPSISSSSSSSSSSPILLSTASIGSSTSSAVVTGPSSNAATTGAEVKCELCSKLFYNREFLAIHKANRHHPGGSLTAPPSSSLANQLKQQQQQQPVERESFCEYCNKSFCNKYFLRTHMLKAHGKTLVIENSSSGVALASEYDTDYSAGIEQQHSGINNLSSSELGESGSSFYQGMAGRGDRVVCDICNKLVCNKYFLRTHKQKVHGIYESASGCVFSSPSSSSLLLPHAVASASERAYGGRYGGQDESAPYGDEDGVVDEDDGDGYDGYEEEQFAAAAAIQHQGKYGSSNGSGVHLQQGSTTGYEGLVQDEEDGENGNELDEGEIK
jgi:hypothetical protein